MEVVEDLLHVAAVAAPVARPNRRLRGRGGARQGRRRQRGVPLWGGAVLSHVCAAVRCGAVLLLPPYRRLRVPERPERVLVLVRRGARCERAVVGLCLSEVGMGWPRGRGLRDAQLEQAKRGGQEKEMGGRQTRKRLRGGMRNGNGQGFRQRGCSFAFSFPRREI